MANRTIKQSLNKAYLKQRIQKNVFDKFKKELTLLLASTDEKQHEEFNKNLISDFLKHSFYSPHHSINTKDRSDLVIHNGAQAKSTVGVLIETKKPNNRAEMLTRANINVKAFQELVLYFLRERINEGNKEIKHLIATNSYEWFVFDAALFEKLFAANKNFVKEFKDFEEKRLSGSKTDFFYKNIAAPFVEKVIPEIEFTHFDLRNYKKALSDSDEKAERKLVELYKILSPEHLLKLPFSNDSNSLDRKFYTELLHIMGLAEWKDKGKKLIGRKAEKDREGGSIIENTIIRLQGHDVLNRMDNPGRFGKTKDERIFNLALELCIVWMNRILFLKLLEGQLISYHKGDVTYAFLNAKRIKNYDDLDSLFFQVLARKPEERDAETQKEFANVPYLNSSLFETTALEHESVFISNLKDDKELSFLSSTVLKNENGKRRKGKMNALHYLFAFLDAYDFGSENADVIREDNKSLINASVLGLIFEKINGYKDGSFFTPGFITMYMCRETIRRAVLQKFNESKGWNCKSIDNLYDKIEDTKEANELINSLKICDPAVGSGHFLVSALNEIIAIKHELKILSDRDGKRLKEYHFEVENDELIVTDEEGELFEYHYKNKESQRVQEALFHEKETIIENCLFGVDINPNSVKICRLRLWIELLKNAYYKNENELETLPNIDINIKCGNSLISRFGLDADLSKALKKSKWNMTSYKLAVSTYRNAESKEQKRKMESLIADIKSNFRSEISQNDPKVKRLYKLNGELTLLTTQTSMFGMDDKAKKAWNKKVNKLSTDIKKLDREIEEIKNNKIYENAFEWRFEFPEVLNDQGDFVGFDVVIGNPPYGRYLGLNEAVTKYLKQRGLYGRTGDVAQYFINLVSTGLLKENYSFSFVVPKGLSYVKSWSDTRDLFLTKVHLNGLVDVGRSFEEAAYEMLIFICTHNPVDVIEAGILRDKTEHLEIIQIPKKLYLEGVFFFAVSYESLAIKRRLSQNTKCVTSEFDAWYGKGGMSPKVNQSGIGIPVLTGREVQKYYIKKSERNWFIENEFLNQEDFLRLIRQKVVVQDIVAHLLKPAPHIKLTATIDNEHRLSLNTVMCFSSLGNWPNEILVAIINSNLMSYYFYEFIFNRAIRTMHFMPGYADKLPIPLEIKDYENILLEHTSTLLKIKKENPNADTSLLENEIDQLVYELYGLNEEEIAIIENGNK